MKSIAHINEKHYIPKNNGKFEKKIWCKTSKQRKRLFNMYIKTTIYRCTAAQNINLIAIRKSKVALKINKPAYIGMCIL